MQQLMCFSILTASTSGRVIESSSNVEQPAAQSKKLSKFRWFNKQDKKSSGENKGARNSSRETTGESGVGTSTDSGTQKADGAEVTADGQVLKKLSSISTQPKLRYQVQKHNRFRKFRYLKNRFVFCSNPLFESVTRCFSQCHANRF